LLLVSLCKRRVLFSSLKKKSKIQQIPKLLLLFLQSNPKKLMRECRKKLL